MARKAAVMVLEPWIEAPPARVLSPVKTFESCKLETIVEDEKEEAKCDGGYQESRDCSIKRRCVISSKLRAFINGSSSFPN